MKRKVIQVAAVAVAAAGAAAGYMLGKKMGEREKMRAAAAAVGAGTAAAAPVYTPAPECSYTRAEKAEQVSTDYYEVVRNAYDGGPNANPVYSPKTETPRTQDGKIDVTKLASPEDFSNWEEHGCQG